MSPLFPGAICREEASLFSVDALPDTRVCIIIGGPSLGAPFLVFFFLLPGWEIRSGTGRGWLGRLYTLLTGLPCKIASDSDGEIG